MVFYQTSFGIAVEQTFKSKCVSDDRITRHPVSPPKVLYREGNIHPGRPDEAGCRGVAPLIYAAGLPGRLFFFQAPEQPALEMDIAAEL